MLVVPRKVERVGMWGAYGLLAVWAGFWGWFSIAEGLSDVAGGWSHLLVPLTPIVVFGGMSLVWPRLGGVLLAVAGVAGLWSFDGWAADVMLSLPAVVVGVTLAMVGQSMRAHRKGAADGEE